MKPRSITTRPPAFSSIATYSTCAAAPIQPRLESALGTQLFAADAADLAGCTFQDGETCAVSIDMPAASLWYVQEGWVQPNWSSLTASQQAEFAGPNLYTEVSLNGSLLPTWSTGVLVDEFDTAVKLEGFQFPATMTGTHLVEVIFGYVTPDGTLSTTLEVTVNIETGAAQRVGAEPTRSGVLFNAGELD